MTELYGSSANALDSLPKELRTITNVNILELYIGDQFYIQLLTCMHVLYPFYCHFLNAFLGWFTCKVMQL